MTQDTKNMLIAWMAEAPSTTMDDIRILCYDRNIPHPAEQIAKWISNKRNSEDKEKRKMYEQTRRNKMTPEKIKEKCDSRKNQRRKPTPSAAGPGIFAEDKLLLETYFFDVSSSPGLLECEALIAKNQWTSLYSAYQIQKWFKNRRKRKVGDREEEIKHRERAVMTSQKRNFREAQKLMIEPLQSSFVPNPINSFGFDSPTLNINDIYTLPVMPLVEYEGFEDDDIFGGLQAIEDVDFLFKDS